MKTRLDSDSRAQHVIMRCVTENWRQWAVGGLRAKLYPLCARLRYFGASVGAQKAVTRSSVFLIVRRKTCASPMVNFHAVHPITSAVMPPQFRNEFIGVNVVKGGMQSLARITACQI